MLYRATSRTLIETVASGLIRSDGTALTTEAIAELARLRGGAIKAGPVARVQVVFMELREAEVLLPACRRFGVECRAIVEGREQVVGLDDEPSGPFVPVLREAGFSELHTVAHRSLLAGGPWLTFGWDAPTSLTRFAPSDLEGRSLEDVEAAAIATLVARRFEPFELSPGVVHVPGEYASEAILVESAMQRCARALGTNRIVVSIPRESRLVAVRADDDVRVASLLQSTRREFDDCSGRRISPVPFLVEDGVLIGVARRPWYRFW